jgi:XTP/dITP diphosphohydrolase
MNHQLLIATHNPAKKIELREGLLPLEKSGVALLFLDDLHITADPEETGKTFEENAQLKSEYFAKLTGLPTVADDGGIMIDALNGQPGVHSKRWLGRDATDEELIAHTLTTLQSIPTGQRTARFHIALWYTNPARNTHHLSSADLDGSIALRVGPDAKRGFPYRALFLVERFHKYYDELTAQEHAEVNHRLKAIRLLVPFIQNDLIQ